MESKNNKSNLSTLAALSNLDPNELLRIQQQFIQNQRQNYPSPPPSPALVNLGSQRQTQSVTATATRRNSHSASDSQNYLYVNPLSPTSQQYFQVPQMTDHNNSRGSIEAESYNHDFDMTAGDTLTDETNQHEDDFVRESNNILSSLKKTVACSKSKASKRKNSNVDQEELIELIRQYPCIWNSRLHSNKEFDKRKNAWDIIAKTLDNGIHSDDLLKKLWKNMRDTFRRCLESRQMATKSGAASSQLKECKFFHQLQFLKDVMSPLATESNINEETVPIDSDQVVEHQVQKKKTKINKTNEQTNGDQVDLMLLQTLQDIDKSTRKNDVNDLDENDPDVMFCRSLIGRLKDLPKKRNTLPD